MYQITGKQVSFRISEFERDELNKVAEILQSKNNVEYSNGKDLTFGILSELKELKAVEPETVEIEKTIEIEVIPEELKAKFAEIKGSVFDGEEL